MQQNNYGTQSMKKKIAIVPSNGLGDGLLWLIFAYNLYQNGYDLVCYSNIICQLSTWFPWLKIEKTPELCNRNKILNAYDFVIAEPFSFASESYQNHTYEILA